MSLWVKSMPWQGALSARMPAWLWTMGLGRLPELPLWFWGRPSTLYPTGHAQVHCTFPRKPATRPRVAWEMWFPIQSEIPTATLRFALLLNETRQDLSGVALKIGMANKRVNCQKSMGYRWTHRRLSGSPNITHSSCHVNTFDSFPSCRITSTVYDVTVIKK